MMGFVESFNDGTDAVVMMRIFCEIPVEESESDVLGLFGEPIVNEILNLGMIHELNIVNMSILLPFDCNVFGLAPRA